MKKGLDVSSHNGNVNWEAVKAAGYGDFAIIRLGIGNDDAAQDDSKFDRNVQECERLGIPYGVYIYSYALNTDEARSEARHTLRQLQKVGPNFKYGVWFDMEDADNYKRNHGMLDHNTLVDICYTFCETVENAGYYTGIYASLSWLNNEINSPRLDRFAKWVAQWNNRCTYTKPYVMWQYTSDLMIGGNRFDANDLVVDFNTGGGPAPAPQPAPSHQQLHLPADAKTWRVYPLNVAPVKGNEKGFLKPSKFGGLTYDILGFSQPDVAIIQTRDFGKCQIYVAPSTGATIS